MSIKSQFAAGLCSPLQLLNGPCLLLLRLRLIPEARIRPALHHTPDCWRPFGPADVLRAQCFRCRPLDYSEYFLTIVAAFGGKLQIEERCSHEGIWTPNNPGLRRPMRHSLQGIERGQSFRQTAPEICPVP